MTCHVRHTATFCDCRWHWVQSTSCLLDGVFAHLVSYQYSQYLHQNTRYLCIGLVFTGITHHYLSAQLYRMRIVNIVFAIDSALKLLCSTGFLPSFTKYRLWIIATTIGVYTSVINALLPRLVILIVYPSVGHWLSIPPSCFASFPAEPASLS